MITFHRTLSTRYLSDFQLFTVKIGNTYMVKIKFIDWNNIIFNSESECSCNELACVCDVDSDMEW